MKKIFIPIMIFLLPLALFGTGTQEGEPAEGVVAGMGKHLEISVGLWNVGNSFSKRDSDAVLKLVEEKFNVTLVPRNVGWADYSEKYQLWAASGELPDVFGIDLINQDNYFKWIDQGVIRPLPADLSAYPHVAEIMELPSVKPIAYQGKYYLLPRLGKSSDYADPQVRGFLVRKDWMEKLGLSQPKSFEDFLALAKAFVERDPDGNGRKDTIGISMVNPYFIDTFFLTVSPGYAGKVWLKEDGRWIPPFLSKNMVQGVKQLGRLYAEGVLDSDFMLIKGIEGLEKFAQGKVGIFSSQIDPTRIMRIKKSWENYGNTDFFEKVTFLHLWPAADGVTYSWRQRPWWSASYFRGDVSDEKMARILAIYDFLLSEEGTRLWRNGIEGVDYKLENGKLVDLRPLDPETGQPILMDIKYPSTLPLLGILANWGRDWNFYLRDPHNLSVFGKENIDFCETWLEWADKNTQPAPIEYIFELSPAGIQEAEFRQASAINDDVVAAIMAGDPEAAWKKTIASYYERGLDKALAEAAEKAKKLGL